jgi:protein-disulfide isomerase
MKKILLLSFLLFNLATNINAETNRIVSGNEDAKITIIAYESLTCSHCASFHKEVYPILKKEFIDTGLVKIEFRHFPLDIAALNASKITQCKQDQSLEIMNSLYSNQQAWVKGNTIEDINENLKKYLNQAGFDINYEKCLNNKEIEDFVLNDRIEGVKNFKINATPTIIINEKKFEKSLNYKNLKKSLEKLI